MAFIPKLALFDVDGTIAEKGILALGITQSFEHLQSLGCITTLSTGRAYVTLKYLLGDSFNTLISPNALLVVEHGTKIVDRDGNAVFGKYFSNEEIEHIVDFIRANIGLFRLAWFNPDGRKVQVCCFDDQYVQAEKEYRGGYADVTSTSIGHLRELLLAEPLSNVTMKLHSHVKVHNLKLAFTRTNTNVIFQDGNMEFVKATANKGLSVLYVAKHLGIAPQDVLLAGNAINDVEMLDLDVGQAILVSSGEVRSTILSYLSSPDKIVNVDTPEELGNYLSHLEAGV